MVMGFNVVGVVIKNKSEDLKKDLGLSNKNIINKYDLGEAIIGDNYSNINYGFNETSSIVINDYFSMDDKKLLELSKKYDLLSFMISDVSSSYYLGYFSKGKKCREFAVAEFEIELDEGDILKGEGETKKEREENIGSDNMFDVIGNFSGIQINSSDLEDIKMVVYSKFDSPVLESSVNTDEGVKDENLPNSDSLLKYIIIAFGIIILVLFIFMLILL